ncbi:hypothetical protein [Haloechinothrix halophila]|uniref:hypothetical protein n=1 Tax=Haloechinothrix halophila TaxID=1069073 RepID=UPI00041DC41F|nr:hypothetical protein [Haloechinothrix halophila]
MTRDQFPQTGRDTPYPPDDPDTERPDGPIPVPEGPDRPPPPDPPPPPVFGQTGEPEQGSTDPFLTIDGIDGESTDTSHGNASTALGAEHTTGENSTTDINGVVTMNGDTAQAVDDGRDEPDVNEDFAGFEFGAGADLNEVEPDSVAAPGETGDAEPEHAIADVTDAEPEHAVADVGDAEPEHAIASTSDDFTHATFENVADEFDAVEDGHSLTDFDMDG